MKTARRMFGFVVTLALFLTACGGMDPKATGIFLPVTMTPTATATPLPTATATDEPPFWAVWFNEEATPTPTPLQPMNTPVAPVDGDVACSDQQLIEGRTYWLTGHMLTADRLDNGVPVFTNTKGQLWIEDTDHAVLATYLGMVPHEYWEGSEKKSRLFPQVQIEDTVWVLAYFPEFSSLRVNCTLQ